MASLANWNAERDFGIPTSAKVEYTYVGGGASNDDLIRSATYSVIKSDPGVTPLTYTQVAVLTFAYVGSTNNLESITRTA